MNLQHPTHPGVPREKGSPSPALSFPQSAQRHLRHAAKCPIPPSSFGIKSSFSSFYEFGNSRRNHGVPGNWNPHLFHLLGDDFFSTAQQEIIFYKV